MGSEVRAALRPAIVLLLLFTLLLGLVYPFAILGLGQALFPAQANGSLLRDGDKVVGSSLIGQSFTTARYFHGRPSAAGAGYDGRASSGSNLGPTSQALIDRTKASLKEVSVPGRLVPPDLVTASASGLDPDISPEAALYQIDRVAAARGVPADTVRALVERSTEQPIAGLLGEPHVNVLLLNRQLDRIAPQRLP